MLRFVSSGHLTIADLRVALFNSIVASQRGEKLIIRIEDIDTKKSIEGADKEVAGLLGLFGIEYQNVLLQSAHLRYYRTFAIQMLHEKRAFNCFCTPAQLTKKHQQAVDNNVPYLYDDTCAHLSPEQTIDNENPFTVRLHHPHSPIVINDILQGEKTYAPDQVDSFVLLDTEKQPTAIFANAIDDMLSDISLVIRDITHLDDTPGQIAMRHAVGYGKEIEYAHLPTLLGATQHVKALLEEGFLPSAIANYLILIGNKTPQEIFTLQESIQWFTLENLSREPETFDIETLKKINREHLRMLDAKELSRYVGFADEDIGNLARVFLNEVSTLGELRAKIDPIFAEKSIPDALREHTEKLKSVIKSASYFDTFEAFKSYLLQETGLRDDALVKPLRLLLTGTEEGPDLADLYPHLKNYLGEIVK